MSPSSASANVSAPAAVTAPVSAASNANWLVGSAALAVSAGIFLSLLMGALDNFVVLTALSNIVTDLGQPNGVTFVVTAYLITSTVGVPIFARLSDIYSRRAVFLIGMVIFIAGSALAGLSQNLNELILFRGVQGFGSGCFFPVGISIIAVAFSPQMRARLTGLFSGVFGIATVAGPFLGSYIVDHTTWRWVFYINIPIGIAGMVVIATSLAALRPAVRERFDGLGAALLSGWVGALMVALFQVSDAHWSWSDPRILGLLATSVAVFLVFLYWELRVDKPLIPLRLFRNRVVASSNAAAAFSRGAGFSILTIISVYVGIVIYHGSAGAADAVRDLLYFMVIPMVVGAFVGGQALARASYRTLVATGTALAAIGLFGLTFVTASTPLWKFAYGFLPDGGLILPLIPLGLGLGMTFGPTTLAVQFQVAPEHVGQATGLIQFLGFLGTSIGLPLFSTYQTFRFDALKPASPPANCFGPVPPPTCGPILASYQNAVLNAIVTSYVDVYWVMFALGVLAFISSLFITGRLPAGKSAGGPGGAA